MTSCFVAKLEAMSPNGQPWRGLVPPSLAVQLAARTAEARDRAVILAVRFFSATVGCAVLVADGPSSGELLLLTVVPAFRHRGIARALLAAVEDAAKKQSLTDLHCSWTGDEDGSPGSVGFVLRRCGWDAEAVEGRHVVVEAQRCADYFLQFTSRLPKPGQVVAWGALTGAQRRELREHLCTMADLPPGLDPFRIEDLTDPALNRAMVQDGRVVAWLMAHWCGPSQVWIPAGYGLPEARNPAVALPLWAGLFAELARETPDVTCGWSTPLTLTPMSQFLHRRRDRPWVSMVTRWSSRRAVLQAAA